MFTEKEKFFLNNQLKSIKGTKKRQLGFSKNGLIKVGEVGEKQLEKEINFIQGIQDKLNKKGDEKK